jgi:hypothetical protein
MLDVQKVRPSRSWEVQIFLAPPHGARSANRTEAWMDDPRFSFGIKRSARYRSVCLIRVENTRALFSWSIDIDITFVRAGFSSRENLRGQGVSQCLAHRISPEAFGFVYFTLRHCNAFCGWVIDNTKQLFLEIRLNGLTRIGAKRRGVVKA